MSLSIKILLSDRPSCFCLTVSVGAKYSSLNASTESFSSLLRSILSRSLSHFPFFQGLILNLCVGPRVFDYSNPRIFKILSTTPIAYFCCLQYVQLLVSLSAHLQINTSFYLILKLSWLSNKLKMLTYVFFVSFDKLLIKRLSLDFLFLKLTYTWQMVEVRTVYFGASIVDHIYKVTYREAVQRCRRCLRMLQIHIPLTIEFSAIAFVNSSWISYAKVNNLLYSVQIIFLCQDHQFLYMFSSGRGC